MVFVAFFSSSVFCFLKIFRHVDFSLQQEKLVLATQYFRTFSLHILLKCDGNRTKECVNEVASFMIPKSSVINLRVGSLLASDSGGLLEISLTFHKIQLKVPAGSTNQVQAHIMAISHFIITALNAMHQNFNLRRKIKFFCLLLWRPLLILQLGLLLSAKIKLLWQK